MLLDIDDSKSINDTYGHMLGDVAGRWGGEEFIVFIPNATAEMPYKISEQIRQQFNQAEFKIDEQIRFNSCVSIGVSDSRACEEGMTIDALVNLTDQSFYRAKANGKNCVDGDMVAL